MNEQQFYEIRNRYLAEGMAFLGYKYRKFGYGRDTVYIFEDTKEFRVALTAFMGIKEKLGVYQ